MKYVCFGEIMGRLSPVGYKRFVQADTFEVIYGGGEANVAASLANFGMDAAYVTKLPDNDIGRSALRTLRAHGVDTSKIAWGGERLGLYYCEKGASQRPSKVVYDRKYSSISAATVADFDWRKIFEGVSWFHFTGITPALSDSCAEICLDACRTAKEMGVTVSCDLNFRKNLWTTEKAGRVMGELMPFVDVAIANEEDCEKVFGIKASGTDITGGKLSHDGYKDVAKQLSERFNIPTVAITLRGSISASDNNWAAMLYANGEYHFSRNYAVHIVDRVGGGDSFGAGLIYALTNGYTAGDALEFAVAASALKHSIEGDMNEVSVAEVKALAGGNGSGRVQR
ncbi:MAG: sugar kinase [Clostridia bacterium]|nr:sugar kinase [Clostridia bacterium]